MRMRPTFTGMEGVHVFIRIDGVEDLVGVDGLGQGELHQDAVDLGVFVVLVQQGQQLGLGNGGGLVVLDGVEAQLMGGFLLGGDVADGTRVFTHQNGDQTRGNIVFGLEFVNFFF